MSGGAPPEVIRSRSNALWLELRRLTRENTAYRRGGLCWIEGEHLCAAALQRGWPVARVVIAESAAGDPQLARLARAAARTTVLADVLFGALSAMESPPRIGALLELPPAGAVAGGVDTVVLDRVQDAGNVGSILRSAAALGVTQVLALAGTASLWSPKVLRSGMGAHFSLRLVEGLSEADLGEALPVLVATDVHAGVPLPAADLPRPCAWVFGHEGQGVSATLAGRCRLRVRIPQPGGEESLNVAAAAAICLYEAMRRRSAAPG